MSTVLAGKDLWTALKTICMGGMAVLYVIPANAGIQVISDSAWIPAKCMPE